MRVSIDRDQRDPLIRASKCEPTKKYPRAGSAMFMIRAVIGYKDAKRHSAVNLENKFALRAKIP